MELNVLVGNNSLRDGELYYLERQPAIGLSTLVVTLVGSVAGTIGNMLVIGAVLTYKRLKKVGNAFIVNLALADLCITIFVNPFTIVGLVHGKPWFMERYAVCMSISVVCLASCAASLLNIGAVSFNRFIHIVYHTYYDKIYTVRNTILMCLGIWLVSSVLIITPFLGWGGHRYDDQTESCVWDRVADLSYTLVALLVAWLIPVILTAACYVKIFFFVRQQKKKVSAMTSKAESGGSKSKRESTKLALTLFIIFLVFLVCWTPYAIVAMADVRDDFPKFLHIFVINLAHFNSSLNGIVYGLADRNFRAGYAHLLRLEKCMKKVTKRGVRLDDSTNGDSAATIPTVAQRIKR